MATFKEDQRKVSIARKAFEQAEKSFYQAKLKTQKSKNPQSLKEVKADLAVTDRAYRNAQKKLSAAISEMYRNHNFKKAAASMDANIPILFLPLRLETRFITTGRLRELWVRIYPDDIHIHSHEPVLTEQEVKYGKHYWISLLTANRDGDDEAEVMKEKAWDDISEMSGFQRALWIVKSTMPKNWQPELAIDHEQLQFPTRIETKSHDWTRAPRTQLLPDKFAVSIIKRSKVVTMKVGNQVPDTVYLGPDPFKAEEAFKKEGKEIKFDESFAWTIDFEEAVKQGLGVKIPVARNAFNRNKIDRVVVMGLLSSATPTESQVMLEQLIESHHYSRKGFGFLPQMSATNNTEESGSAYERNEDYLPKGYYDGSSIQDLDNLPNSEGNNYAEYLGIKSDILDEVNHAGMTESLEALAMNKALYPSTVGNFIEVLSDPVVKKSAFPKIRKFFNSYVTAAGPIPSIRVGDQPYGTLLTSDLRQWKETDSFHIGMTNVMARLQLKWDQIMKAKVSHVGKGGDPSQLMLNILGLNAGSVNFNQRLGHLPDVWNTMPTFDILLGTFFHKQTEIVNFLVSLGFERGNMGYPNVSNLSFYEFINSIPSNNLVDRKNPSDTRFLEKIGATGKNYVEWLMSVRKVAELEGQKIGGSPPRTILYLLLRHSILQELKKATEIFYGSKNVPYKRAAFEKSLYNFNKDVNDISEWEILKGVPKKVHATKFKVNEPLGDHLLKIRGNSEAARNLKQMRKAMKVLAELPTSKLHKHLSDHIDLVSYRLDAWQTGLFYRRMLNKRKEKPEGIYIGAYGWVEDLRVKSEQTINVPAALKPTDGKPVRKLNENAGFVHTPSLNHATAAGVLLAGYQNHATKNDPGPFAVNLSSERVRRAMFVFEGIQNNQSMECLLGYQFERALHDITTENPSNNLNQYILALREKFPIESASIPQQGNEAQETVSPFSVVNGMKIVNAKSNEIKAIVSNSDHSILVLKEKDRLEDTIDALNDLLVSEAAFQATQGKTDRTVGILNALKNAELPPDLEVNKTPRSTHLSITNRVTLHFNRSAAKSAGPGWASTASPRSGVEPGLNHWLAQVIGSPAKIICSVSNIDVDGNESAETNIALSELKLQPIDLVYMAGEDIQAGARELEFQIIRRYKEKVVVPNENKLKVRFEPNKPGANNRSLVRVLPLIRNLKIVVSTSRPGSAKDFEPKSKKQTKDADLAFGWHVANLNSRVKSVLGKLKLHRSNLITKAPNSKQPKSRDNPSNFKKLFQFYQEEGASRDYIRNIVFTNSAIDELLNFVTNANLFGIKTTVPEQLDRSNSDQVLDLVEKAASILLSMNKTIDLATVKVKEVPTEPNINKKVNRLIEAGKAVLGGDFNIIPLFKYTNPVDVASSLKTNQSDQLLKFINQKQGSTNELSMESWIESVSRVRENMSRLEHVRMVSEAQGGGEVLFSPAQMPFKEGDSWLAVEFPEIDERTDERYDIKDDTICLSVHGDIASKSGSFQSVLIVDEWTEFVPNEKEVTGVAFNYDQPNASAPNTMLLAVEPTGSKTWNWDILMGILDDTLRRAKTRAVEPAQLLEDVALDTLSPMTVANFDLHRTGVSLDYLITSDEFLAKAKVKNFGLYKDFKL